MKSVYYFIFVILLLSCSPKSTPVGTSEKKKKQVSTADYIAQGFVKATVIDLTGLDGCRFLLQLEDGSRLEPENLDTAFAKAGTPVWVKYFFQKNAISICMAGKVVHIADILKREP